MNSENLCHFRPEVQEAVCKLPLPPLGPGDPLPGMCSAWRHDPQSLFPQPIIDRSMALACQAGILLLWNHLDDSHAIVQGWRHREGRYWHYLMHRRETDFSNAAYWLQQTGAHPLHQKLLLEAQSLLATQAMDKAWTYLRQARQWPAEAFLQHCARAIDRRDAEEELLRRLALRENMLLLAYCAERAILA